MRLLEEDYLGGQGSRGYGRISFDDVEIKGVQLLINAWCRKETNHTYTGNPNPNHGSEPSYEHVQFQLICQPLQQLHFGNYCREKDTALEDTGEIIHADTLFSAIISTAAEQLERIVWQIISGFHRRQIIPQLSLLWLKKRRKLLRFYPKPVTADFFKVPDGKKIKRIRYVSDGILNQGITPDQWSGTDCVIIQRCFVALRKELEDLGLKEQIWKDLEIFRKETVMKVQVQRDAQAQNDAGPYAQTNLVLADHSAIGLQVFFGLKRA